MVKTRQAARSKAKDDRSLDTEMTIICQPCSVFLEKLTVTSFDILIGLKNGLDRADIVLKNILNGSSHDIIKEVQRLSKRLLGKNKYLYNYYQQNIVISHDSAIELCAETMLQSCDTWKNARKFRITGSRCYSYYTHSQQKSQDWSYKLSGIFKPRFFCNFAMRHGTENEENARKAYMKQYNVLVIPMGVIINPLAPWFGYSPDGMVVQNGEPVKLIEIKCPVKGLEQSAKKVYENTAYYDRNTQSLRKRHPYYGQMQMGMALTGLKMCDFIIYAPYNDSVAVEEVAFDEEFVADMAMSLTVVFFNIMLPYFVDNCDDCDDNLIQGPCKIQKV